LDISVGASAHEDEENDVTFAGISIENAVQFALIVSGALLTSVLLAWWFDDIVELFGSGIAAARASAARLVEAARACWSGHLAVWRRHHVPLVRPVARELAHLSTVVATAGEKQVGDLERIRLELSLAGVAPQPAVAGPGEAAPAATRPPPSLVATALICVFILLLAAVNYWLLRIFFLEVLGGDPIMTRPVLLYPGHVVALMFPLVEVAAGFALYFLEPRYAEERAVDRFFWWCGWAVLAALALVEMVAYGVLSRNADFPSLLAMDRRNALYHVILYALAPFGAAITLVLAALTHKACSLAAEHRAAARAKRLELARNRRELDAPALLRVLEQLDARTKEVAKAVPRVCDELISELQLRLPAGNTTEKQSLLNAVDKHEEALFAGQLGDSDAFANLAQRQAWLNLVQLLSWATCGAILTYFVASTSWSIVAEPGVALAIGIALPLLVTSAGVLIYGDAYGRRAHLRAWGRDSGRRRLRTFAWVALLLVAVVLGGYLGTESRAFGSHKLAGMIVGVVVVLALALLSSILPDAMHVLPLVVSVAARGAYASVILAAWTSLRGLALTLAFVLWFVKLLAIPGRVLRRSLARPREARKPTAALPPNTGTV
jgi:hypothetical protein